MARPIRTRYAFRCAGTLILAGWLAACGDVPPQRTESPDAAGGSADSQKAVARYAGKTLTVDDVNAEIARLPAPSRTYLSAPDRRRQFVENLVVNDLLYREGEKAGYASDPEIQRQVEDLRRRLVVQRVVRQHQTPPALTDADVEKHYQDNQDLYSTTQIRVRHILVKTEDIARRLLEQVRRDPDTFPDVARAHSTDTSTAQKGGDLGLFAPGRMVLEFDRAAFGLRTPGEISNVVKTQYGFHLIQLVERKEGTVKPFDQVKERIRVTLRNHLAKEQMDEHLAGLKTAADLTIDEDALGELALGPASGEGASPHNPHAH
jgi:peptidyl-prolyl cis-trans isomerase C